ncbi:hypothetical protein NC653_006521 [Populus alba x Populus x berolinensis]|uniref:Uncharacterized protein n=1 Tax=Populus alba x Populus x berolinensis TaxID=444605 RepID=A0AAD6REW5_9ROSI|nr:hypothetical protein NC653_006521 [Populus alba x Populus x berolinensis]
MRSLNASHVQDVSMLSLHLAVRMELRVLAVSGESKSYFWSFERRSSRGYPPRPQFMKLTLPPPFLLYGWITATIHRSVWSRNPTIPCPENVTFNPI